MVHYIKFTLAIFNFSCLTLKLIEKIGFFYFWNNSSPVFSTKMSFQYSVDINLHRASVTRQKNDLCWYHSELLLFKQASLFTYLVRLQGIWKKNWAKSPIFFFAYVLLLPRWMASLRNLILVNRNELKWNLHENCLVKDCRYQRVERFAM